MEYKQLEAGFENVPIKLKSKVDLYVGKVIETSDDEGNKVIAVVTSIDKVFVSEGKITLDCKLEPLYAIK